MRDLTRSMTIAQVHSRPIRGLIGHDLSHLSEAKHLGRVEAIIRRPHAECGDIQPHPDVGATWPNGTRTGLQ
jgi:hypothetical protein